MTNLAGVDSGIAPMTPVLFGTVVVLAAAVVAAIALRRVPGVPALCSALGVASLYPIAWHAPEWWNISDHSAPVLEWPVICLEVLAAVLIMVSVFQIRRAWAERDVPEDEESYA
jgi:hypothetical protein